MKNEKARLRDRFRRLRAEIKSEEKDEAIFLNFIASPFFERTSFFIYHSVSTEADTLKLIEYLLSHGKRVLLPRIENGEMYSVPYTKERELLFGIPQPEGGKEEEAEVVITPLLAFDKEGYRLGYGGGYYDKYFARHGGEKVGLAYAGQETEALLHEPHDERLDGVVTEEGARYFT